MVGYWLKRAAVVIVIIMHFMIWPQTVEDMDVLAAEPSLQAEPLSLASTIAQASPVPSVDKPLPEPTPIQPQVFVQEPQEPQEPIDSHAVFASLTAGDRTGGLERRTAYEVPSQPTVYLTFDDGPTKLTPEVLDILKKYNVKATFFVLGQLAEKQEDIIRRIHEEGHAIGNHTYNHKYDELYGDFSSFWKQVSQTDEILQNMIGDKVSILRAPGGTATNFDAFYFYYLESAGYKIHDWTVDSGDSKRRSVPASEIIQNVKKAKLTHEVNLLMHDGAGHSETVKALPEIIEYYRSQGYQFAAIDERVKPVMFQVRDIKWKRAVDEQQHDRMIAAILEPESKLVTNEQVKVLSVEAPALVSERIGLREWASERGSVAWDSDTEAAIISIGITQYKFLTKTGEVLKQQLGTESERINIAFEFANGRISMSQADAYALEAYQRDIASRGF